MMTQQGYSGLSAVITFDLIALQRGISSDLNIKIRNVADRLTDSPKD